MSVSLVLSRCLRNQGAGGRWLLRFEESLRPDLTIAVRMNETNDAIKDYYLFPAIDLVDPTTRLADSNHAGLDAYRFDSLEFFFEMAERVNVEQAAA